MENKYCMIVKSEGCSNCEHSKQLLNDYISNKVIRLVTIDSENSIESSEAIRLAHSYHITEAGKQVIDVTEGIVFSVNDFLDKMKVK